LGCPLVTDEPIGAAFFGKRGSGGTEASKREHLKVGGIAEMAHLRLSPHETRKATRRKKTIIGQADRWGDHRW